MTRPSYKADFWHGGRLHHIIFDVIYSSFADRKVDGQNR